MAVVKLNVKGIVRKILFVASGFALCCRVSAAAPDAQKLADANNAFAFDLLKQLAKDQPSENLFISPYSAATVLEMVCDGADGQTKEQMQQVLHITSLPPDTVNVAVKTATASLNSRDANVILSTANALWYRKGISVNREFTARNQEFFGATVEALNFDDPRSGEVINKWASQKTHGKINNIADGLLNRVTELLLVNAVYFKGKWETPFDAKATRDRVFHLRGGQQKKSPMMEQSRRFTYRRGTGYQAVRLNYEGWSLGMYVFLPDANSSPEKLLALMTGDTWQRVTEPGFSEREGTVVLPKFRMEYGVELKRALQKLGMKSAFENRANFSGISSEPLFISTVRQQTFVEVNEEGTEAAAATAVPIDSAYEPNPPKPFQMIVDRPFLFLIEDKETRTILFMGIIFNPGA